MVDRTALSLILVKHGIVAATLGTFIILFSDLQKVLLPLACPVSQIRFNHKFFLVSKN
jgi:hypothetical protein